MIAIVVLLWYFTALGMLHELRDRLMDAVHAWAFDPPSQR